MYPFLHDVNACRVVFGPGTVAEVAAEAALLGGRRVLVVSGGHAKLLADRVADDLGGVLVARIDEAVQHVPADVARDAVALSDDVAADLLIAVGGGSPIGLAKMVARERGIPILAVPTTYAGSEMSAIWGVTEGGNKVTGRDVKVQPRTVIYDPDTTLTMPPALSATSGMNAISHSAEALYAPNVAPLVRLAAVESIRSLSAALPKVIADPIAVGVRSELMYGAYLAGLALGGAVMGVHHKICHVLGGTYGLPHGAVHSALLPYAMAFNRQAAPTAMAQLADALGAVDGPVALWELGSAIGAPTDLLSTGFGAAQIDDVATFVAGSAFANPRPVTVANIRALLEAACGGQPPSA